MLKEPLYGGSWYLRLAFKLLSLHSNYSNHEKNNLQRYVVISFQITIFTQQLQLQSKYILSSYVVISFQITIFTQQLQPNSLNVRIERSCD